LTQNAPLVPSSRLAPLRAVSIAAALAFVADAAIVAARGMSSPAAYLAFCAAVTAACALAAGGVVSAAGAGIALALALWAGLNGALAPAHEQHQLLLGVGFALAAWGALAIRGRDASVLGAASGTALALVGALIFWPRVVQVIHSDAPAGLPGAILLVVAFAAMLAVHSLYARLRRRLPRLPSDALLAAGLLLLAPVVMWAGRSVLWAARAPESSPPAAAATNADPDLPTVLVLILDTVRADHLSVYGYERDTTPSLRALVARRGDSVVYPFAFAPASWTLPSHASLFTGVISSTHGVHSANVTTLAGAVNCDASNLAEQRALAEVLGERGYRTGAVFANPQLTVCRGLDRGFDLYHMPDSPRPLYLLGEGIRVRAVPWLFASALKPHPSAEQVNEGILSFLDGCAGAPCFVVANYMEAHAPYAPAPPHAGLFSDGAGGSGPQRLRWAESAGDVALVQALYDEEIHALDHALGALFDALDERGLLDRAWIFVTSDHGEAFGEHGTLSHGHSAYNEEVRIPLIVSPPRGVSLAGRDGAVSLIDVTATIAAVAGAPRLGAGRDLRQSAGPDAPVQIEIYESVHDRNEPQEPGRAKTKPSRAVVIGREKLVEIGQRRELYHLGDDPGERQDRSAHDGARVEALARELPPMHTGEAVPQETAPLSPEMRQRLKALGYID
jgi:arylsulfatase A-like enzyme